MKKPEIPGFSGGTEKRQKTGKIRVLDTFAINPCEKCDFSGFYSGKCMFVEYFYKIDHFIKNYNFYDHRSIKFIKHKLIIYKIINL